MISEIQKEKARIFQNLHKNNKLFILPGAWSIGSAYIFEKQGFSAVGTSSAGIAYNLGYPDGEAISLDDYVWIIEKMAKRLTIPLSVDFERGYAETPFEVKENAKRLLYAGAVGFNIEDGVPENNTISPLDVQLAKIKALVELKKELDIDFVINARTCTYWLNIANENTKLKTAIERGNAFADVGADCIFIPGALNEQTVSQLVRNIKAPLNIILNNTFNDYKKLENIGVRRLSGGSSLARYITDNTILKATQLLNGNVNEILKTELSYQRANDYFFAKYDIPAR